MIRRYIALVSLALLLAMPGASFAASTSSFDVSGWIPYWKVSDGVKEAKAHLSTFTSLNPFVFTVQSDGSLKDLGNIGNSTWKKLFTSARSKNIQIIPTITMGDGAIIDTLLSSEKTRAQHIKNITTTVKKYSFDGVEIDYEGKKASTKDAYSAFLKELKSALGSKLLVCDVEPRTPPDSLYRVIPTNLQYANDLKVLNTYCDTVKIMAYDQQRADIKLNDSNKGAPYIPVADVAWVKKVANYMSKDIAKNKLVLGIPTYGAEWTLTVSPNWFQSYSKQWSVNPEYATDLADDLNITPEQNTAGEMSFTYLSDDSPVKIAKNLSVPRNTSEANMAAAKALAYANKTGKTVTVNVVWWSDADAIKAKMNLAQELGLKGVAIFKIDGGADKNIWKKVF